MNYKKLIVTAIAAALFILPSSAQDSMTAAQYKERYDLLVARLGSSGVGIETLIQRWEKSYPEDVDMLQAGFLYYLAKGQSSQVVVKEQPKYLGQEPMLSLKDSTGNDVRYYQEIVYDDALFEKSIQYIDKAVQLNPDRLDLRLARVTALTSYEKESPDMAASSLKSLVDYNYSQKPKWEYEGIEKIDNEVFDGLIQEYCYTFFRYGVPSGYNAFRDISQKVLAYNPNSVLFLDNMGSYYLVAEKDSKTAQKYYAKVLKIKKDDITAIKNLVIMARKDKNIKLEKKYLPLYVQYAETEAEKLSAKARLDYLNGKK